MKSLLIASAFFLTSTFAASAATSFDLTGAGGKDASYSYTVDGITLTTSGGRFDASGAVTVGSVVEHSTGTGVSSGSGDFFQIDGANGDDILIFSFDQDILLESITFADVDGGDKFSFFFDGNGDGDFTDKNDTWTSGIDVPGSSGLGNYAFTDAWFGRTFGIGATGDADNFLIDSITVSVSTVPLPAALPLYGAGIAMLGFMGWRRKRKISQI